MREKIHINAYPHRISLTKLDMYSSINGLATPGKTVTVMGWGHTSICKFENTAYLFVFPNVILIVTNE